MAKRRRRRRNPSKKSQQNLLIYAALAVGAYYVITQTATGQNLVASLNGSVNGGP
jgi:hypothetical protein